MASNNLKKVLSSEGIAVGRLSAITGLSAAFILKIVRGSRLPSPKTILRIVSGINRLAQKHYRVADVFAGARSPITSAQPEGRDDFDDDQSEDADGDPDGGGLAGDGSTDY